MFAKGKDTGGALNCGFLLVAAAKLHHRFDWFPPRVHAFCVKSNNEHSAAVADVMSVKWRHNIVLLSQTLKRNPIDILEPHLFHDISICEYSLLGKTLSVSSYRKTNIFFSWLGKGLPDLRPTLKVSNSLIIPFEIVIRQVVSLKQSKKALFPNKGPGGFIWRTQRGCLRVFDQPRASNGNCFLRTLHVQLFNLVFLSSMKWSNFAARTACNCIAAC